jgi:heterodisulfide reductase subunit B
MAERPLLRERVNEALGAGGLHYEPGSLDVRHLIDVIVHEVGLEQVRRKVTRPLAGLRVAPYMGCMLPRPDYDHRWSDHEYPDELDRLLEALGAEVIDFPLKAHCCGGHMPHIGPETAFELLRRLLDGAAHYDAHVIATVCPMCQMNLDAYQGETNRHFGTSFHMPVVFFTQLMGLAFGIAPDRLGIGTELVDARPMLERIGVEAPAAPPATKKKPAPRRKGDKSLPMPGRIGAEEVTS